MPVAGDLLCCMLVRACARAAHDQRNSTADDAATTASAPARGDHRATPTPLGRMAASARGAAATHQLRRGGTSLWLRVADISSDMWIDGAGASPSAATTRSACSLSPLAPHLSGSHHGGFAAMASAAASITGQPDGHELDVQRQHVGGISGMAAAFLARNFDVTNSTFSGNVAWGGGIANTGYLTVTN